MPLGNVFDISNDMDASSGHLDSKDSVPRVGNDDLGVQVAHPEVRESVTGEILYTMKCTKCVYTAYIPAKYRTKNSLFKVWRNRLTGPPGSAGGSIVQSSMF